MAIAVLMGGTSAERPISLLTGAEVIGDLLRRGRSAFPVVMEAGGRFRFGRVPRGEAEVKALLGSPELPDGSPLLAETVDLGDALNRLRSPSVDLVFIALHGCPGEDGGLQGCFELAGIPFTGSGLRASAITIDKCVYKAVVRQAGLPTPDFVVVTRDRWRRDPEGEARRVLAGCGLPLVVKANDLGSSVGVHLVRDESDLVPSLDDALARSARALCERFVAGVELTCAVLGPPDFERTRALPLVEIRPRRDSWFDFASKYETGGADEIVPARVPEAVTLRMQEMSRRIHALVGCEGLSRTDAILGEGGLQILETNTIPGLTRASLAPKAAEADGLGFSGLVDAMCALALDDDAELGGPDADSPQREAGAGA